MWVFFFFFFLTKPGSQAPGIEPMPPALGVWNLNHWSIREVLFKTFPNVKNLHDITNNE